MAATNPFKVSDLIKKYGWTILPYLSNLGVRSLAEAQVLFVDSGNTTNGLDADDGEHGHSFEKPLLTADYATGLCTADEGAVILFAPGHNENLSAAINFDVAGVTYIGLGTGTLRPRFDFDAAASSINIGASNVTLANLTFMPGYADVLIGVDIEAAVTNARVVDCEFVEGEASGDEFLAAIELKAGCHDTIIEDNIFRAGWSSNPDDGVSLKGASNNVTIRNSRFSGPYGDGGGVTAAISNSTGVCLDLLIENNIMKVKDGESGIEVIATTPAVCRHNTIISTGCTIDDMIVATIGELDQNIGITTDGTSGEFIKGGAISPEVVQYSLDHLAKTADGSEVYPASVTTNSILGMIMSTDGDVSNFSKTTDSLQSIRDAITAIDNTTNLNTAVPDTPTAKSLQDILSKADGENTYDNTTDSLEAISEALANGTGCTAAIDADGLDHLVSTTDGDQAYPASLQDHTILASIMTSDGDVSGYDRATDSLEAIADAISALSWATAVSQTPTARSMQDILEKDNTGSFDDATDSLEAISDSLLLAIGDVGTPAAGSALDILKKLYYTADGTDEYPATVANDSTLAKIMAKGSTATASTFNNTTDSLEALRDHLDGPTILGGIQLDHLVQTVAPGTNYPSNVTTDSILAMIMASDGDVSGYNKTTDSLQAIRDYIAGTTALDAINLDHLALTTTGVAADGELDGHITAGSILGHLMATDADPSNYDASTDSLQAIADSITAGVTCGAGINLDHLLKTTTGVDADGDLSGHVTTKSVLAHIMSADADVTTGYNASTDSLAAIAAALAAGTGCTAAIDADQLDHLMSTTTGVAAGEDLEAYAVAGSLMAHITSVGADVSTFDCQTDSLEAIANAVSTVDGIVDMGRQTVKAAGVALDDGDVNVFTIATGPVKITSLFFIMTEATDANSKAGFTCTPTAGSETDLTTTGGAGVELNTSADAGDIVYSELDGTVMVIANTDGGAMPKVPEYSQIVPIGSINLAMENGDPTAGIADVYVQWEPLAPGATLTATS